MSERRDAILKASATAIAQRGIRGLRVNDVAEVAGVSPGLLYYHFKDRIGLLEAALNYINDRARAYRSEGEGSGDSARDRLTRSLLGEIQDRPRGRGELVGLERVTRLRGVRGGAAGAPPRTDHRGVGVGDRRRDHAGAGHRRDLPARSTPPRPPRSR